MWEQSAGAVAYRATVTGEHGHVANCSSDGTSCSMKLDCGHHYTALVVGTTPECDGVPSATLEFDSGQRLPDVLFRGSLR